MKSALHVRTVLFGIVALVSAQLLADWTYDSSAGTISDGKWTFAATVKKGTTELTVAAVSADPGAGATLDLSLPISDGTTTYTLVTLNPNFGAYANAANLTALVLPTEGLTTISKDAFKNCTSLTSVSPFLPDSVNSVGESAFASVPVEAALSLKGVVTVDKKAFMKSSVTAVTFGSALKTLTGGWESGCFYSCSKLTTLDFDPTGSGATFNGESVFASCSKITGTVDLRGFSSLGNRPFYNSKCSISKFLLSSGITDCNNSFFNSVSKVKQISFDGGVPTCIDKVIAAYNDTNHTWSDLYTIVPEANKDAWAAYCENDAINTINSYWDPELVTKAKTSNLYLVYQGSGGGGEKGYWVFDGQQVASTNGLWAFSATKVGAIGLQVGACTKYPETPTALDFSQSVTDKDGVAMVFASYAGLFYVNKAQIGGYDKVLSVAFADQSTSVGESAFRGCVQLTGTVVIPDMISTIGPNAFNGCTGLTALELGGGLANVDSYAFNGCTSLASVSPCLPDSLTTIGDYAFDSCPITGDCSLKGIETIKSSGIRNTKLCSIYIGPKLQTLGGGYGKGAICSNGELTNLTFAAGITNATTLGEHALCYNSKLGGTIDFSGFVKFSGGRPLEKAQVTNIIFGAQLTSIPANMLETLPKLQSICFLGKAPSGVEAIFNQPTRTGRIGKNQDVVTYVRWAHKDSWRPYANNRELNAKRSTWSPEYLAPEVTDLAKRRLLAADAPSQGLVLIIH